MSPYLSEKSSDFGEILYTAADFELDERHLALVYLSWGATDHTYRHWLCENVKNTKFSCLYSILV